MLQSYRLACRRGLSPRLFWGHQQAPRRTLRTSKGTKQSAAAAALTGGPANSKKDHRFTKTPTINRVGFIGLGNMGFPMALNLSKHDDVSTVLAYDTNEFVCQEIVKSGQGKIQKANSLIDIVLSAAEGEGCHVIFTMLPGCQAVDHVMTQLNYELGEEKLPAPLCFVDCSTVSPTTSRHWQERWAVDGHRFYDAPVSGGVKGAEAGELTFMVGGASSSITSSDDINQVEAMEQLVRPLLEQMGKRVILCGGPGAGAATKLCNNLALATQMIGVCEALNLGEALGVDPAVLADAMNTSTAGCWSSRVNNPHPAAANAIKSSSSSSGGGEGPPACRNYDGGFGSKLMLKDLGLATAAAEECKVAMPLTATSKELYRMADLSGLGEKDFGVMLQYLKGKNLPS